METIQVDANNFCAKKLAETEAKIADMRAEVTRMQGNAEKEIAPVLEKKRKYEYLHAKLDAACMSCTSPRPRR